MKLPSFKDMIVAEYDDYLFINKPPFLSTLEDRNDRLNVLKLARDYLPNLQVCHRLDKETSGILALAKHKEAYAHLAVLLEKRRVHKIYHTLVDGIHNFKDQLVDEPLTILGNGTARVDRQAGKPASTRFDTLDVYRKNSLVSCRPESGRLHQIRIHISLLKAPIIGDTQYGGKPFFLSSVKSNYNLKRDTEEQPLMKRVALHALSLQFENMQGKMIEVSAPYPKDFKVTMKQLERYR